VDDCFKVAAKRVWEQVALTLAKCATSVGFEVFTAASEKVTVF
jgi:hypothetical protein